MSESRFTSRKFIVTVLCIALSTILPLFDADVPEGVYVAAITAYNLANAYVAAKRNDYVEANATERNSYVEREWSE